MNCPECGAGKVKTLDTRSYVDSEEGFYYTERRRECISCGNKYKTLEVDIEVWYARRQHGNNTGSKG
jgi:transcriptional regulator NrdR family protein